MKVYYNDNEPTCVAWLKELVRAGLISDGDVDDRDIHDVEAKDLKGYTQAHFFAGIAGWPYALKLAAWPKDKEVWTGSCPCQPYSVAGKGKGDDDPRNLWPIWRELILECRPPVVFGEQVASASVVGRVTQTTRQRLRDKVPHETQGKRPHPPRAETCGTQVLLFQPSQAHRTDTGSDRCRTLRADRASVQFAGRQNMGQPLIGPDRSAQRLPLQQHPSRVSRHQQCVGRLGRESPDCYGVSDLEQTKGAVKQLVAALGREAQSQSEWPWFTRVQLDLERAGYTVGASVLPAAGVGAPHIRQRLWWVADATGHERRSYDSRQTRNKECRGAEPARGGAARRMADARKQRRQQDAGSPPCDEEADGRARRNRGKQDSDHELTGHGEDGPGGLDNTTGQRAIKRKSPKPQGDGAKDGVPWETSQGSGSDKGLGDASAKRWPWEAYELVGCADGKARRVEPGTFPLADGVPGRVGLLRGYGNSIVPQVAAEFVIAYLEARIELEQRRQNA